MYQGNGRIWNKLLKFKENAEPHFKGGYASVTPVN